MLHKLKPLPRAIVIIGIVAIAGYGLTMVDFAKFKKAEVPVTANTVEAPVVTTVAPPAAQTPLQNAEAAVAAARAATPAPAPAPTPAPAPAPAPAGKDAGLDALLK